MKKTIAILIGSTLSMYAADVTVAKMYDSQLGMAESEIVSLAKAVPETAYAFAPTQGAFEKVRTFGAQAKHIATVMYMVSAAAKQEKPPVDLGAGEDGPATVKSKAEIVKYLQDAFAYAHKTMGTLTTANELDMLKPPFPGMPEMPRGALANLAIWHSFDHYGQMVVYARMNNVIPPASMPAPAPAKKK